MKKLTDNHSLQPVQCIGLCQTRKSVSYFRTRLHRSSRYAKPHQGLTKDSKHNNERNGKWTSVQQHFTYQHNPTD